MTDTERLAHDASIPPELAAIVVLEANRAQVSVRAFRRNGRPRNLIPCRRHAIAAARNAGFSWWQIGRAMNRDHSTCIYAYRKATGARA